MIMIELEPEHCEFKENIKKVKTIFIENYTDEYKDGDADKKIIEELRGIGENRLAKLYDKHKDYNDMMFEISGWKQQ
jgi:hypothetical protein|nr:MAG TPA: hypothetical protein [Caudoviricetes sp.]